MYPVDPDTLAKELRAPSKVGDGDPAKIGVQFEIPAGPIGPNVTLFRPAEDARTDKFDTLKAAAWK